MSVNTFCLTCRCSYLHEQSPPFIHRNLTSANVLLTSPKLDVRLNIVCLPF
jgi:serine/threonine protein kinase